VTAAIIPLTPRGGFERGAVVRLVAGGPNMLVLRSGAEETACAFCAGPGDEKLRFRSFATRLLALALPAVSP